jgi:hypothetical protein
MFHWFIFINILVFYFIIKIKKIDGVSLGLVESIDTWTNEFNGVFRIGAVDCD